MRGSALGRTLALVVGGAALASPAAAQTGHPSRITTLGSPFVETSAGRAMQRITFGNFDQSSDFFEVFRNGSYQDLRSGRCPAPPTPCPGGDSSNFLLNRIVTQSQTFPLVSPAGSFAFTWKEGAEPTLDSEFLGPLYAERGTTVGKNQLSVIVSYQHATWESLNESLIRNDEAGFNWGDFDYSGTGRSYVARSRMNITSDTAVLGVNFGITPRLDIRALVPVVHTSVEGSNEFIDFTVDRLNRITQVGEETGLTPQGRYYVQGESTGVGDIDLGLKYAILRQGTSALSLAGTARLGTGSFDKMTGTGETSGYFAILSSFEYRGIGTAFEVGYRVAGDPLYDELDTRVGISFRAIPNRLTLTGEYVGRRILNVRNIFAGTVLQANVIVPGSSLEPYDLQQYEGFIQDVSLFLVGGGLKVRLTDTLVATGYALFPVGSQALQPQTPVWNVALNVGF